MSFQLNSPLWKDKTLAAGAITGMVSLLKGRSEQFNIMEVCGTHTMAIAASGLRRMLPPGLKMLSGPGCPVCVTAPGDVDRAVAIAQEPGVILATFGDMMKVRGIEKSLDDCRISGADIRVVYSPLDAVEIAVRNPGKKVVFLGVGFETTIPVIGASVLHAEAAGTDNFLVLPLFKLVPPALQAVLSIPGHKIHGLILPGHVSVIIGVKPYEFVAEKHRVPCVITGFEPMDILNAINMLLKQTAKGMPFVEVEYSRVVKPQGNPAALAVIEKVFSRIDAHWRAVGLIKDSGLGFSSAYTRFDAGGYFDVPYKDTPEPAGCLCGQVLMGRAVPADCGLFGRACTPSNAVGPCMVSSEGACAAWYKYGEG
ncbi:MAG: hydrogenase formation protein HypD [bacterium]